MRLGDLRQGFGRLHLLAGPLEYIRPFLGPLYVWASIGPKCVRPTLPVMVLLIMRYLAEELKSNDMMACDAPAENLGELCRFDVKADRGNLRLEDVE